MTMTMTMQLDRRGFFRVTAGAAALGALTAYGLPATRAHAASGFDYTSREAFDETLRTFIDSGANGQHHDDNETGGLAWGQSYVLLGLMRMYETYEDTAYLDTFVTHANAVLGNRDEERGVTDYLGRSGPVWRAGGNYTASHVTLVDAAGTPTVQVRNADSRSAESEVEVRPGSEPGTFTLAMTHATIGTTTVEDLSTDPSHPRFVESTVTEEGYYLWGRWTAKVLAPGVPQAGSYAAVQQYYAFAVHTGMIVYPMALFARTVLESTALSRSRYRGPAQRYLAAVRRAIDFHSAEYTVTDEGYGTYAWPKGAPVPFDGTEQPHNQSHGVGQALAEMYRITGRSDYRTMVEQMASAWRVDLEDQGGWWAWRYWPTWSRLYQGYAIEDDVSEYTPWYNGATQWEDISHAAISVEFAAAANGAGIGFTDGDLATFGRSYLEGLVLDEDSVRTRFLTPAEAPVGTAVQAPRWLALDRVEPAIAGHSLEIYESNDFQPSYGSHVLGVAYLNYGAKDGWG